VVKQTGLAFLREEEREMDLHSHGCHIRTCLGVRLGSPIAGGSSLQERLPVDAGQRPLQQQAPGTARMLCLCSIRDHPCRTTPGVQIGQEQGDVQAHTRSTGVYADQSCEQSRGKKAPMPQLIGCTCLPRSTSFTASFPFCSVTEYTIEGGTYLLWGTRLCYTVGGWSDAL